MNEILREIRVEYEQIQVKNRDEAEEWYKVRRGFLLATASLSLEKMRRVGGEIKKQYDGVGKSTNGNRRLPKTSVTARNGA